LFKKVFLLLPLIWALSAIVGAASPTDTLRFHGCSVIAIPVNEAFELDGNLSEGFWRRAPIAERFVQRVPNTGKPASQHTEVRIVIMGSNLVVGAYMYDSAPDSIAKTLFRKDGSVFSDWFSISFDSYNDRRTAFSFDVNPLGVRRDFMYIDDRIEDYSWEAVWQTAAKIQPDGWSVEIRIPLSQLRYSASQTSEWGVNIARHIARRNEWSFWAPTPPEIPGWVSQFGRMEGAEHIRRMRRFEVIPYVSQQLKTNGEAAAGNPYVKQIEHVTNAGVDFRLGLGPDFTMTTAINPDFGQAEVDPAVVNLSAFEVFFPERRSFFLEGMEIFRFGQTRTFNVSARPTFFYSRRIGRAPAGGIPEDYDYADIPLNTTIAAASKVSGKTKNGWSLGLLDAYTTKESAPYRRRDLSTGSAVVEPASNFFVGRVKKDFDGGKSVLGGFFSATNRMLNDEHLKNAMRSDAYLFGLDFEHNWLNRQYTISGTFTGSLVRGSEDVMIATQRSNIRSYQRPDADYLRVDSSATSLSGYWAELALARRRGRWVSSATLMRLSPGFEVNDLGFQTMADRHGVNFYHEYQQNKPIGIFQNFSVFTFIDYIWNYGGNLVEHDYFFGSNFRFRNFWSFRLNGNYTPEIYNDRLTRGGPNARRPSDWRVQGSFGSDSRKKVAATVGAMRRWDASGEWDKEIWFDIAIRPAPAINVTISPSYNWQFDTDQYVTSYNDAAAIQTFGRRWVFADIHQKTLSASIRMEWTFLPDLSLQVFAQPFYSAGRYSNYKAFARPGAFAFNTYADNTGGFVNNGDGTLTVDADGTSGPAVSRTFADQDFNVASLRGNGVVRWEFRPGTIFFLIWQQNRIDSINDSRFQVIDDNRRLFDRKPVNIFLAKLSWWFG
jgi:hypothetical protein